MFHLFIWLTYLGCSHSSCILAPLLKWGAPGSLKLNVQCWEAYQTNSQTLREMCNPCRDIELDERLKGVYASMHPQAFRIATHLAVLDRLDTEESTPLLLNSTGSVAKRLPRYGVAVQRGCCIKWIAGEAQDEHLLQQRILEMFRLAGQQGEKLHVGYKNLRVKQQKN